MASYATPYANLVSDVIPTKHYQELQNPNVTQNVKKNPKGNVTQGIKDKEGNCKERATGLVSSDQSFVKIVQFKIRNKLSAVSESKSSIDLLGTYCDGVHTAIHRPHKCSDELCICPVAIKHAKWP